MTVEVDSYLGSVLGADLGQGLILRDEYLQLLDYILICLFVFSDRVSSTAQPGLELAEGVAENNLERQILKPVGVGRVGHHVQFMSRTSSTPGKQDPPSCLLSLTTTVKEFFQ